MSLFSRDKDNTTKDTTDSKENKVLGSVNAKAKEGKGEDRSEKEKEEERMNQEEKTREGGRAGIFKRFSFSSADSLNQTKQNQEDRYIVFDFIIFTFLVKSTKNFIVIKGVKYKITSFNMLSLTV